MKIKLFFLLALSTLCSLVQANQLPSGFVYLKEVDPTIVQEMRYQGNHNFIGHPIYGYKSAGCILTKPAALALKQVQTELRRSSLSLKVYDCYRPQHAVNSFVEWSKQSDQQQMKAEFYPRVNKAYVFKLGYIAEKSGHSRGSTIDLTIVPYPQPAQASYQPGQPLHSCYAPHRIRFHDNSLDMGTGFDCLDETAHVDYQNISPVAFYNRVFFSKIMQKHGFVPYTKEWWHFTLKEEPYKTTYFDFPLL